MTLLRTESGCRWKVDDRPSPAICPAVAIAARCAAAVRSRTEVRGKPWTSKLIPSPLNRVLRFNGAASSGYVVLRLAFSDSLLFCLMPCSGGYIWRAIVLARDGFLDNLLAYIVHLEIRVTVAHPEERILHHVAAGG